MVCTQNKPTRTREHEHASVQRRGDLGWGPQVTAREPAGWASRAPRWARRADTSYRAVLRRLEPLPGIAGKTRMLHANPPPPPTAARDWKPKQTTQQAPPCMFWQQYHSRLPGLTSPKPGTPRDEGCFCINKTFRGKRKKNQIYFLLEEGKKPSHLRVLWVWWSCQTTSKLSPGLTSPKISDPLGAEVQVGPTVGGN